MRKVLLLSILILTFVLPGKMLAQLPGENCGNALNLASLPNPFSGTTVGYANDIGTCRTGYADRVFYIDVPAGSVFEIWEPSNSYDEWEYVGYGPTCPGATQIQCWDNDGLGDFDDEEDCEACKL